MGDINILEMLWSLTRLYCNQTLSVHLRFGKHACRSLGRARTGPGMFFTIYLCIRKYKAALRSVCFVLDKVFVHGTGWHQTLCVVQAGLKLPPSSLAPILGLLGLQLFTTIPCQFLTHHASPPSPWLLGLELLSLQMLGKCSATELPSESSYKVTDHIKEGSLS